MLNANRALQSLLVGMIPFWAWCSVVCGLDYSDFPPEVQLILDERIVALQGGGGICIAGRVNLSDGAPIQSGADAQVNFQRGLDEPTRMYAGGWFVMSRTRSSSYAGSGSHLAARAFGYDPLDAAIHVLDGEITYADLELLKTPSEELASVWGTVTDEDGQPFFGAVVSVSFPFANFGVGNHPRMVLTTGSSGAFDFSGLSSAALLVHAWAANYANHGETVTPPVGGNVVANRRLYPNRRIELRYVYQADGSRDFTGGDLRSGRISWLNGTGGVDFAQGLVVNTVPQQHSRDLELAQIQDELRFRIFYSNGMNGYYDAGAIDFDSLTAAATTGYQTGLQSAIVGHVYVVRTYQEGHYAKFIVESDEYSFRTVVPPDPDPLIFSGYGLSADFSFVAGHGIISVEKHHSHAAGFEDVSLPWVWKLSGMQGVPFVLDLRISYLESDLIQRRLPERGLTMIASSNGGNTWHKLDTVHNETTRELSVDDLLSLGWFAIANLSELYWGDLDGNLYVDLRDYFLFQQCFTGGSGAVGSAMCVPAMADDNLTVDHDDFAPFAECLGGPANEPSASCRR